MNNSLEKALEKVGPTSFTTSAFIIGMLLAQDLTTPEQSSIGNWLQLAGITISTFSSQAAVVSAAKTRNSKQNNKQSSNISDEKRIETLRQTLSKMQSELERICQ